MAADILKLKKEAVAKGMPKDQARSANRAELTAFLAKPVRKAAPAKKSSAVVKKAPARKTAATKAPVRKPAAKKPVPAKAPATRKTAKRPATSNTNGDAGRNTIDNSALDYNLTDGWNPRPGSAVEMIFKALKKYRGNVDKTFDALLPNITKIVGATKADKTKRTKQDRENMLRYRISRTKFDFAIKTMQHEIATERVEYGTGAYATTRSKNAPVKRKAVVKPAAKRVASKPAARRPAAKKTAAARR
jgi:hypothetical protein